MSLKLMGLKTFGILKGVKGKKVRGRKKDPNPIISTFAHSLEITGFQKGLT